MRAARPVREPWATFSVSRMCPAGVMLGNPKRALSSRTNNNSDVCHRQRRFTCTRRSHRTRRTRTNSTNSITRRHPERHRAAFGVFAQPPCSARCALGVRQGRSRGSTGPRPPSRCQTKRDFDRVRRVRSSSSSSKGQPPWFHATSRHLTASFQGDDET